ncbi:MAG: J domain-containing protein [Acidimicrobiales bacterium]
MSYYDDLGLSPSANDHEIRARYRELARIAHPDVGGDPTVFRLLTEAYEVLGDPAARRVYDAGLADRSGGSPRPPRPGPARPDADPAPAPATDRWATAGTRHAPQQGHFFAETFEGLFSLTATDLGPLGRRSLVGAVAGAAAGAGIGLFTGQATALAFGFALIAAVAAVIAFGHGRYRDGQ